MPRKSKKAVKDLSDYEFDSAMYRLGRVCYLAGWAARDVQGSKNPPLTEAEAGWKNLEADLIRQFGTKPRKSFFTE